jgi:hypothetical protein
MKLDVLHLKMRPTEKHGRSDQKFWEWVMYVWGIREERILEVLDFYMRGSPQENIGPANIYFERCETWGRRQAMFSNGWGLGRWDGDERLMYTQKVVLLVLDQADLRRQT